MAAVPPTHPVIGEEAVRELCHIIRNGNLAQGQVVEALEAAFAGHVGTRYAVALSSGTAALHLALLAHGIGAGDGVITSPLCLPAVGTAILATGATPVYADINPYTYTISPLEADRAAQHVTRNAQLANSRCALLAIHLFGQPCDMAALAGIAQRYGLVLIEVAWEALGAQYDGVRVGSFGTTCYSFQQGMSIATGEGGMQTTEDKEVATAVRRMANYGCDRGGRVQGPGFNYRMTDVTAALAQAQLPLVDAHVELQRYWASELAYGLTGFPGLIPPAVLPGAAHAFLRYAVRITPKFPLRPEEVRRSLHDQGIEAALCHLLPLHQHPFYSSLCGPAQSLCQAERVAQELLFLPLHPYLEEPDAERMVHSLRRMATYVPAGEY